MSSVAALQTPSPLADLKSDLSPAKVLSIEPNGKALVRLNGHGPNVLVSRKQVKEFEIEEGDNLIVVLANRKSSPPHIIVREKVTDDSSVLTARFANPEKTRIRLIDPTIKTEFGIAADSATPDPKSYAFYVQVPQDFNLQDPHLRISENQSQDPESNASIADIILEKHGSQRRFKPAEISEAKELSDIDFMSHPGFARYRRDTLDIPFVTIDPKDSQDLDDAVFVEQFADGVYRTVVAITDVPSLIPSGSEIDRAAYARVVSYYMKDKTHHMLPDSLSADLCSLRENQIRPAVIYEAFFEENGEKKGQRVSLGLVKSRQQMSYGEFYDATVDGDPRFRDFKSFHETVRRQSRMEKDQHIAHDLVTTSGSVETFHGYAIVSTLMTQANAGLADYLAEKQMPFIYRVNGPGLSSSNYKKARARLAEIGYELPKRAQDCTWDVLDEVMQQAQRDRNEQAVVRILREKIIDRAFYDTHNTGHFSLRVPRYGHFTSPIRRYSDIVNLRALHTVMGASDIRLGLEETSSLQRTCNHLNRAREVERRIDKDIGKFHLLNEMRRYKGDSMRLVVTDFNRQSMEVLIPRTGLRNTIVFNQQAGFKSAKIVDEALVLTGTDGTELRAERNDGINAVIGDVRTYEGTWDVQLPLSSKLLPT